MKYTFLSFLFILVLSSCSPSNPSRDTPQGNTVPNIDMGGVQISGSGVSVSDDEGNTSVDTSGNVLIKNASGSVSVGDDGINVTSGSDAVKVWKDGISVGTGIKIPTNGTDGMEKDSEVESITKDIDKIFSDIENGGK